MAGRDDASIGWPVRRPRHRPGRSLLAAALLALAAAILGAVVVSARAQTVDPEPSGRHGDGHARMHDIYKYWHPPNNSGTSCCNNADCRPTRAYVDGAGEWRAWNGSAWLRVPQERVLPSDYAGDGRSHLCEKEGFVYCFTPGEIRG